VPGATTPDFHTGEVAATVLGTGRASRLYRTLVREKRIAKDVMAFLFPLETGPALFLFVITGYPGARPESLEEALVAEMEDLAAVDTWELERAVALTETGLLQEIQRVGTRADLLSMFDQYFDDPDRLNTELERLRAVDREQVRAYARDYLGPDNRAILTYVPESKT
jgi:predicted Zn-dependent peptidase